MSGKVAERATIVLFSRLPSCFQRAADETHKHVRLSEDNNLNEDAEEDESFEDKRRKQHSATLPCLK